MSKLLKKKPIQACQNDVGEEKSGKTREELEGYNRQQYCDSSRNEPLGLPGHVRHPALPVSQAKHEKKDLHVIWLDQANTYGLVPHQPTN